MKSSFLLSLLTLAASAANAQVSYDGYKVFRVPSESEEAALDLQNVISTLELETWKQPMKAGAFADIMVPPDKLTKFESLVGDKNPIVMHEDLGSSIAEEGTFDSYQGKSAGG